MDQMIGMALGLVVIGAALAPGATGQTGSSRFPQLSQEELNGEQQRAVAEISKQSISGIGGLWNVMLRSPEMAERLAKLLYYLRFETSLPLRLNEFAILITARHWSAQYEWWTHHRWAKEEGLSEEVMADLAQGKRPERMRPDEEIVYDFCTELHRTHFVSDATFQKAKDLLGEQPLVDLMAVCGAYTLVSMLLNTAGVMPKDGSRPLPPLGDC